MVRQQAEAILAEARDDNDASPLLTTGKHWPKRWLAQHKEFTRVKAKPIKIAWKLAQLEEQVTSWFNRSRKRLDELGVYPDNMWNFDQTGC
jgi:hypothetical protein